ncbi:CubicO group peptidase, beta-lactamase class C family [Zhouia amylolytica]|uniref:CubicO group peptidase, beta-lactamase class C family n=1 Tax=Zhouia amylolytica TaxID=376730 RepID=A0A1I6UM21_9FLAO|nr:serine hydrolase domain-containing protein [Zhouia amylolytica]SFT02509.1 CubicO group peptidase, beta-lactamase class C family [Zhouia amylolytica]
MKNAIRLLILSFLCIACKQNNQSNQATTQPTASDSLTAELEGIWKNGQINGFAVAMVDQNGVLYTKGFGYADRETKKEYTENTIQHIASVSKTLIGIALMKAKEIGKLQLDDPIENYLPFQVINPNYPDKKITIRHLATHTSGINDSDQYMNKAWILEKDQDLSKVSTDYPYQQLNPPEADMPMETFLKEYLTTTGEYYQNDHYINFKPGERYNYSNIGATLCALIIEKATGEAFDTFTQKHILDPLQMNDTGWSLAAIDRSMHSRLYRNDNTVLPFYKGITYPDGMLISSSSDMAKYLLELVKGYSGEGTLLKKESYKEFFTEQLDARHFNERNSSNPYNGDYSPAIFIGHSAKGYVGHSGGDAGVGTWFYFNKEDKTGRYIVINTDMGNDNRAKELEYYEIWDTMNEYFNRLRP